MLADIISGIITGVAKGVFNVGKEGVVAVSNEVTIQGSRAYRYVTTDRPLSPEESALKTEQYRAAADRIRAKVARSKQVDAAQLIKDSPDDEELFLNYKNDINTQLNINAKAIQELNDSIFYQLNGSKLSAKLAEKNVLLTLLRAKTLTALRVLSQQQAEDINPDLEKTPVVIALLKEILRNDDAPIAHRKSV